MLVACDLLLGELHKYLEVYLIDTKANWLRLRFAHVYKTSFENDKLQELQKWCNDIVAKYPSKVFESEGFTTFPEKSLVSILERDDLQMEEGRIWDHVIKWGIAQIPNLPSETKDWSRENCSTLKNTLQNCLPLIRYFQMSNEDIIDKVKPYKKILDKQLWEDILRKFLTPNRPITTTILPPRSPFSAVITKTQAAEISSWIDKKADPYTDVNNPYEFRLLLSGTRDGFTTDSFWNLCDKQEKLIIVMKVKDTDEIIGGYNPIGWDKSVNNWTNCDDTFIFSLKNGTIDESILSRIKDPQYAVGSYSDCGAQLGRGSDLFTGNNFDKEKKCYCNQTSYEKPIRNTRDWFSVSEYEVFQIYEKA
ncbi:hypothetical protein C2G38_263185 [Gigaspora rosea]|uniref:TLDc domain-containing protein n=1 Tax=Gigaspora rosea TaxID=44941 RepID=A0A397UGV4_9GLOM|nr:hypothetical protein C2G38_263185 [Gigaspora rosea]